MVELPIDESRDDKSQVIFPVDDLWVPVACVNGNIHICKADLVRILQMFTSTSMSLFIRLSKLGGSNSA